ncbi:hypothetical protein TRAPUB_9904 [Trametes pubescens]|uniref:Uncharacterized protein n=1 Tax=Trametes pubescens TaxID=154538 RepID=A0A1M2W194_TRAPU|nr:hypothetical protein TRAPUB_9904 [Trametes pubescens]
MPNMRQHVQKFTLSAFPGYSVRENISPSFTPPSPTFLPLQSRASTPIGVAVCRDAQDHWYSTRNSPLGPRAWQTAIGPRRVRASRRVSDRTAERPLRAGDEGAPSRGRVYSAGPRAASRWEQRVRCVGGACRARSELQGMGWGGQTTAAWQPRSRLSKGGPLLH